MQSEHIQMPIHITVFSSVTHWDGFILRQEQEALINKGINEFDYSIFQG